MAGKVEIVLPNPKQNLVNIKCHLMPCEIKYAGISSVDNLFSIHPKENQSDDPTASFRGRELNGKEMDIPEGYKGVILTENEKEPITTRIENLVYWNWDKIVTGNDVFIKMVDWLDISKALHSD